MTQGLNLDLLRLQADLTNLASRKPPEGGGHVLKTHTEVPVIMSVLQTQRFARKSWQTQPQLRNPMLLHLQDRCGQLPWQPELPACTR